MPIHTAIRLAHGGQPLPQYGFRVPASVPTAPDWKMRRELMSRSFTTWVG